MLLQKMSKQNRNRLIDTEMRLTLPDVRVLGGWVKKEKGLRSTNWQLQNSHRDVKYRIGNIVSNIVIVYGVRWVLEIWGAYDCLT